MKRNEWENEYQRQMGDTIWLDDCPDEKRLARIDRTVASALEFIEEQVERIRKLQQLRSDYVPKETIKWADVPNVSITYGTGTCGGCGKIRGSGAILNGVPCECGYIPVPVFPSLLGNEGE
jgi:hypothetical protein